MCFELIAGEEEKTGFCRVFTLFRLKFQLHLKALIRLAAHFIKC